MKQSIKSAFFIFNTYLLLALMAITAVFWLSNLDVAISSYFYLGNDVWRGPDNSYLAFFYYPMNAIIFSIPLFVGFPMLFLSLSKRPFFDKIRLYKSHGFLLVLTTMLGAGLINSVIVKAIFARPRPVAYFNGDLVYFRPFEVATSYWGLLDASFPSGHVSIAFVLIGFFFIFKDGNKRWMKVVAWGVGVALTLILGISMIISRISFGHHYLSDGIWGGAFTYFFALAMYYAFKIPQKTQAINAYKVREKSQAQPIDILILVSSIVFSIVFAIYFIFTFGGLTSI